MTRYAVGIEYDGTGLVGWQQQVSAPSVQALVETALASVLDHPVEVTSAGRTDAGVHARCLVAHFDTEADRSTRSITLGANTQLPNGVSLQWARPMPPHFHARYSAVARSYRYCILNRPIRSALCAGRAAFVFKPLDVLPMQAAAVMLLGKHDFSALRAAECQARSPIRNLFKLEVRRCGEWVLIEAQANAFLHHMVRNLAGLLIHIGLGEASPAFAKEVLLGLDRKRAPATAPAAGLYLWRVHYPAVFGLPDDSAMIAPPTGTPGDLLDPPHVLV